MHLPIDNALLPKDNLAQDHKIHLNNVLSRLETTRKIATENIKAAQANTNISLTKGHRNPSFSQQTVYCTKVAVGKAPKLHRKWAGPYYITLLGSESHLQSTELCNKQRGKVTDQWCKTQTIL